MGKLTLKDVRACFYGVPKALYSVGKNEKNQIIVWTDCKICKHWYAIDKLKQRYNAIKENPLSNVYIINALSEN